MAMISDKPKLVTVFGGTGFLGRYIIRALTNRGYRVRVAARDPHTAIRVQALGNVSQVQIVQANLRYRWSIDRAVAGADHVINLVGIMNESGRQRFGALHIAGARAVAEAAQAAGATLTHTSAIGADIDSPTAYARTKAQGERAVLEAMPTAVIMRPSIVFGQEDKFFNRFANMARFSPFLPLIGGGETKFQPVYVGDLAEAYAQAADGLLQPGTYELGGPQILTFRECMEETLDVIERERRLVSIPWSLARIQGRILGLLPKPMLTLDQVNMLKTDNIVSDEARAAGRTLEGMGIVRQSLRTVLPTYLWSYRPSGQYTQPQA